MFGMTSLPVEAWLGGTARGRPRQVMPVCSHLRQNPADPELWVPRADTGLRSGWWVDPRHPHLSSGQPAALPDRQPVGFSHAPRAALLGCSALFPALPGHGSATNRVPPFAAAPALFPGRPVLSSGSIALVWRSQSWAARPPRGRSWGPSGSPMSLDGAGAILAPLLLSQADGMERGTR